MDARFDGRVVLVTGAAQGIGRAIALAVASGGAAGVMISDRNADDAQAILSELRAAGAAADFAPADLASPNAADVIFDAALARFGRVDGLVNAAGITTRGSVADATPEAWDALFAVNARAPFFLMQRLVNHLVARQAGGSIVNILSINAHGGLGELAVYSASKAALALLTRNLAQAHRFDRIRANGINLGWAETPGEHHMQSVVLGNGPDWIEQARTSQPFGRLIAPEDVARLAAYLLSDLSIPMMGTIVDFEQWVPGVRGAG
jgi:NAD(P)-dependent dehydrogenase (short-subunit alcohol dehydrogenase family)